MRMTKQLLGLAMVGLVCAAPAAAQDSKGFLVGGNLGYGFDQPYKTTNSHFAASLEVGYEGRIYGTDVPFRPMLSVNYLPGKSEKGLKTSLTGFQLAGDVLVPTPIKGLRSVFGLSLNKWSVSKSGTEEDGVTAFPIKETKGIKFGARLGLEYSLTDKLAVCSMLQWMEIGTSPEALYDENNPDGGRNDLAKGGQNAVILQFGVKYKF